MKISKLPLNRIANLYRNKTTFVLLILVLFASCTLITINFYTLRITSAVRAYIGGESNYSKAQKDALLYLSTYIQTEDESYYTLFEQEIAVPKGDNLARHGLTQQGPTEAIKQGFLMGRNNPADLDNMIWLFTTCKSVSFMRMAIQVWEGAEPLINSIDSIGNETHSQMRAGELTVAEKQSAIRKLNVITAQLSKMEMTFSTVLGNAARTINHYLFLINIFCIILILGGLIVYAVFMINRLSRSEQTLKDSNLELTNTSKELDTFVYSASHDLRSPIASLKGLVDLIIREDEPETAKAYFGLMIGIVDQLDVFIKEIIDFFRNKRTLVTPQEVSLQKLVDEAIALVQFMPGAYNIIITKQFDVDVIQGDELRLKIILNNLISNAIKYSDFAKEERYIKIRTRCDSANRCIIEIEDNGIGIKKELHERIFDMFFVTQNNNKGTGLGLYIVKETVEKLNGHIQLVSEINAGSTFIVDIPV